MKPTIVYLASSDVMTSASERYICSSVRRLPVSPPTACDIIGSLYAVQFLIYSTCVLLKRFVRKISKIAQIIELSVQSNVPQNN